jgi:hypothetical protein
MTSTFKYGFFTMASRNAVGGVGKDLLSARQFALRFAPA